METYFGFVRKFVEISFTIGFGSGIENSLQTTTFLG
jgi:hypothetical protein